MKNKAQMALVKRAMREDKAAFIKLCELKVREVVYLCDLQLGNRQDAEDAAQEVFIRVQKNISRLRSAEAFNVWLNRLVVSTCHNYRRDHLKDARTLPLPLEEPVGTLPSMAEGMLPEDWLEDNEKRQKLVQLVRQLPDKYRDCVLLHYFQNLSYNEVARVLDITTGSVESRLRNARKLLRAQMEQELGAHLPLGMGAALARVLREGAQETATVAKARLCLEKAGVYAGRYLRAGARAGFRIWRQAGLAAALLAATGAGVFAVLQMPSTSLSTPVVSSLPQGWGQGVGSDVEEFSALHTLPTELVGSVHMVRGEESIARATVALVAPDGQTVASVEVAPDGRYEFRDLRLTAPGEYVLRLDAYGESGPIPAEDVTVQIEYIE